MKKRTRITISLSLILTLFAASCSAAETIEPGSPTESSAITTLEEQTQANETSAANQPDPDANSDSFLDWHHYESTDELVEQADHIYVLTDLEYSETLERNIGHGIPLLYDYYSAKLLVSEGETVTEEPYTLRLLAGSESEGARALIEEDYEYYLVFVNGSEEQGTPLNPYQGIYGYDDGEVIDLSDDYFELELDKLDEVPEITQILQKP